MRNLRLDICYDGSRYKGWQRLPESTNTIQGKLETTLSKILGEEISVSGSGRTDAGTHALHQVVSFHCENGMPTEEILANLRRYLPEDIGIYSCKVASDRFHARLNAKEKTYRYRVWNSDAPCVFDRKYVFVVPVNLNLSAMKQAAGHYLGTHDFSAFCGNKNAKKSTIRHISAFHVDRVGDEIHFTVIGNGFLHHMVRIMVGTLLEVGKNERDGNAISDLFGAKRESAGPLIPACGLCLMEVRY